MFNTNQGVFAVRGLGDFNTKQGVFGPGGHGGGIFQTTVSGLGTTAQGAALQAEANAILPQLGLPKIAEDGVIGPKTCGAIKAIIASGKYSGWSLPSACNTMPSSPAIDLEYAYKEPMGTGAKLAIVGATVLAVFGGYWAWKKYK